MENFTDKLMDATMPVLMILLLLLLGFLLFGMPVVAYYQSCFSARIFNEQNGTSYTCWDFFMAADQINSQTSTIRIK